MERVMTQGLRSVFAVEEELVKTTHAFSGCVRCIGASAVTV